MPKYVAYALRVVLGVVSGDVLMCCALFATMCLFCCALFSVCCCKEFASAWCVLSVFCLVVLRLSRCLCCVCFAVVVRCSKYVADVARVVLGVLCNDVSMCSAQF